MKAYQSSCVLYIDWIAEKITNWLNTCHNF